MKKFATLTSLILCLSPCYGTSTNPSTLGSYAFISDYSGNHIQKCSINQDGTLDNCQSFGSSAIFNNPIGIAIRDNNIYVNNSAFDETSKVKSSFTQCQLNPDSTPKICQVYTPTGKGSLNNPTGFTFNNEFAYITNFSNSTYTMCNVTDNNININSCTTSNLINLPSGGTPEVIVFNKVFAYITDQKDDGYLKCNVNPNGSLDLCQFNPLVNTNGGVKPVGPRGLMFNGDYAYFVNSAYHGGEPVIGAVSSYTKCDVNAEGTLSNCSTSTPAAPGELNSPTAIVKRGNSAYITNEQGPGYNYTKCNIGQRFGTLSNCTTRQTGGSSSTIVPAYTQLVFLN